MKNDDALAKLKLLILEKEAEQEVAANLLKDYFNDSFKNLSPMNLLKNGIREVAASSDLKTNLVNTAIGLTAGVVAKKLYTGKSKNPITIMLGTLLEVGVTNFISKNADGIKNVGGYVLKKMLSHTADSKKA